MTVGSHGFSRIDELDNPVGIGRHQVQAAIGVGKTCIIPVEKSLKNIHTARLKIWYIWFGLEMYSNYYPWVKKRADRFRL